MTVTSTVTTISVELSLPQAFEALNALTYRRHHIEQSIRDIRLGRTMLTAEDRKATLEGLRKAYDDTAEAERVIRQAFHIAHELVTA